MVNDNKYRLVRGAIETSEGIKKRWLITRNYIPYIDANEWLYRYSESTDSTAKEYGSKLVVFLNFLDMLNKDYKKGTKKDIHNFIYYLMANKTLDFNQFNINDNIGFSTIRKYITVIKSFYKRMAESTDDSTILLVKSKYNKNKYTFMYGQIWNTSYDELIDEVVNKCKNSREYIKWYTEDEKKALLSATKSLRDKALLLLTFEGLRIDEALSVRIYDYDSNNQVITPSRSKGKNSKADIRVVSLPNETCKILDNYINTERVDAEIESGEITDYIFINLIKGPNQGKPMKYSTALDMLKRAAKRCGIDSALIRTHSGRSTKVMEVLEHQTLYPEDNITDDMIRKMFGWENIKSLEPYRDRNNLIIAKSAAAKIHARKGNKRNE